MKISMYIIARWMRQYSPVCSIVDGNMELEGIRMFSPSIPPSTRYVYVARNADFFGMCDTNEVLLIHRNDVIHLSTEDIEDVFNQVVGAFEYYRNLEYRLTLATHLAQPEQTIIDLCAQEFGVAYIMSRKYHIIAISAPKGEGDYASIWRSLRETRLVPMERLREMKDVGFYKNINRRVRNLVFPSELTSPYCYGVMNSYCDAAGKIIGQCMIAFDREVEKADLQLVDVFMDFLHSIEKKTDVANGNYIAEMLFDELIHGQSCRAEDLLKVTRIQRWSEQTRFCVICCEPVSVSGASVYDQTYLMTGLQQNLYRRRANSVSVLDKVSLACCFPIDPAQTESEVQYISRMLPELRQTDNIRTGISYAFRDFTESAIYFKQAQAALAFAREKNRIYASIADCALNICLLNPDIPFVKSCCHRLLELLRRTDLNGGTHYYETLRQYLRCERSFLRTAEEMGIHRNTVVYRIERIQQMYPPLDLENPEEREYLMLSYRLEQRVAALL